MSERRSIAGLPDCSKLSIEPATGSDDPLSIPHHSMLAQSVAAQGTSRFEKIVENRFFTGQDFNRGDHARDDRQWIGLGSQVVLFGPYHHPVKGLRAFGFFLVVDNGVRADALDLALQRAID